MAIMDVPAAAATLGMGRSAVRKAIVRGTLLATLVSGGRRGREYAIGDAEIERYRATHRRPGHKRVRP